MNVFYITTLSTVFTFGLLFGNSLKAQSLKRIFEIDKQSNQKQMFVFSVPYSMGVHEGYSKKLFSQVELNSDESIHSALFVVKISDLTTKNSTRDCHMREALGIDYNGSSFPKEHVCNSENQIPEAGPDSIRFPEIKAEFVRLPSPLEGPIMLGLPVQTSVELKLIVHGVTQTLTVPVTISKIALSSAANQNFSFRVTSKFKINIADFKIKIKPFEIGPIKISVKNQVDVLVDLLLSEVL